MLSAAIQFGRFSMRTIAAVMVMVGTVGLLRGGETKTYTSEKGRFAIAFPATAKVDTLEQKGGASALVRYKGNDYQVIYKDFPEGIKPDPKVLFDIGEKAALRDGGKLISSEALAHGTKKYPAREYVSANKAGEKSRTRMVLAGNRMYIVAVSGPDDFADSDGAKEFIKSLEIK
jgi:hypothetical protein